MKISIIIPTLNNATLVHTLQAIETQTHKPHEIIVIGCDEMKITEGFPSVRFVDTKLPMCAAAVRNIGMKTAQGEIFIFTDSDCIPNPDWIAQHLSLQQQGKSIVGGGIVITNSNYWAQSDNISMFHEFLHTHPRGKRKLLPTLNLSIHRTIWQAVGDMDESFQGAAGEDSDWTIRMRQAGFELYFEPTAIVRHAPLRVSGMSLARHWLHSGYNNIRVRLRYEQEYQTPFWGKQVWGLRLLSPLIALYTTLAIFKNSQSWPYWRSIPIVYATKIIYCWGAARAIQDKSALQ